MNAGDRKSRLESLIAQSKAVIHQALDRFGPKGLCAAMTGGKDSTACVWLLRQVCIERREKTPACVFIDEGDVFEEVWTLVSSLQKQWQLDLIVLRNDDVLKQARGIGMPIDVKVLNDQNRKALRELGVDAKEIPFFPDSPVMNHLMKTVPLRNFIQEAGIGALITAIRWDEQNARTKETYFSSRSRPDHVRVHPMLHFTERDIWDLHFAYQIPFNVLYERGYRSLGARCATRKLTDVPAWLQDLENTQERAGRGQDKEQIMDQLRALGYM